MNFKLSQKQFYELMIFAEKELNAELEKEKGPAFLNRSYYTISQRAYRNYVEPIDITHEHKLEAFIDTGLESYITINVDKKFKNLTIKCLEGIFIVKNAFQKFMFSEFGEKYATHLAMLANKKYKNQKERLEQAYNKKLNYLETERNAALKEIDKLKAQEEMEESTL